MALLRSFDVKHADGAAACNARARMHKVGAVDAPGRPAAGAALLVALFVAGHTLALSLKRAHFALDGCVIIIVNGNGIIIVIIVAVVVVVVVFVFCLFVFAREVLPIIFSSCSSDDQMGGG